MAETAPLISSNGAGGLEPESDSALFHRRVEFHQARKQFNGFVKDSSSFGFKMVTLNPTISGPVKVSGSANKSDKDESTELSGAGLDPEISFEISFRRIGAGLRNLGNTCFLNSVLQCLTYTAPLAAYLQSGKHQNSCRTAGFCALCAIQRHVSRALQSTGRILEPKDLVSNLRCISRSFRNARQEDAHEYMVNLLESMHRCCLPSGVPTESPSAYDKSLVHKIFGGQLRSQVKCMQCSYGSNKFDPFLDLSLEIPKADSLYKALSHFTAKEQLDGGAREYQCEQCRQKVKALKQLTIHKAPQVLAVHLKRFSSLVPGQKIDKEVSFEPTLDLKPFVTGPYDGDLKYTLYGVLVHYGFSTRSGHYYCFVRTSSGMWYSLDDNEVVQVSERKVLEQKAYMLFYVHDRKYFCPSTVNAIQKEKMVTSSIGSAAYAKLNLEPKEKSQIVSDEQKIDGTCSATLSGKDAPLTPPPEETPSGKMSSNTNGKLTVDHFGLMSNPKCKSLMVPQTNAPLKEYSSVEINSGGVNGSGGASVLSHMAENITCNNALSVIEEHNTNTIVLPDCSMPQDSAEKPPGSYLLSTVLTVKCKRDGAILETNASTSIPMGTVGEPSIKSNHMPPSSLENSLRDGQVPVTSCIGTSTMKAVGPNTDGTIENGQTSDAQSKLSKIPATAESSRLGLTKKKRKDLKVKRKLLQYQAITMSLSSNIIFGGSLSVRMRKKQKKCHNMLKKSPKPKDMLGENELSLKLRKSAEEKPFSPVVGHSTCSTEKKAKHVSVSDGQNQNLRIQKATGDGSISGDPIDNDFREGILMDGATTSAEERPHLRQSIAQGTGVSERELTETDVMRILTRGLEETTVGRWNDTGVSVSEKSVKKPAGNTQIGYIGDEWDEEYDRGKRKKVRVARINYDGSNLFQEISDQRTNAKEMSERKRKRVKMGKRRNGNQSFRI